MKYFIQFSKALKQKNILSPLKMENILLCGTSLKIQQVVYGNKYF